MRAKLALDTGWTFDYIDNLNIRDLGDIYSYQAGLNKWENEAHGG